MNMGYHDAMRVRVRRRFVVSLIPIAFAACTGAPVRTEAEHGRIEESRFVTIGNIEQFITIRGDDRSNPVLLFIHGGPGDVQSPFVAEYAAYESAFTFVQWDQRGAGRTYGKYGDDTPDLTLDRLVADGIELSEYLKSYLGVSGIVLLGHSWGSVIGAEMAIRRPDLFDAYVGTGQVGSWDRGVRYQYDFVRAAVGDRSVREELGSPGDFDPRDLGDFLAINGLLRERLGAADRSWLEKTGERTREEVSPDDAEAIGGGMNLSGRTLYSTQVGVDLFATASHFEIPFIVIQGSEDLFTPTPVAVDYFDRVEAPRKELHIIPGAGHFAVVTHAQEFLSALIEATSTSPDGHGRRD